MDYSDLEELYKTEFMHWYETQTEPSAEDDAQYDNDEKMVHFSVKNHVRVWLLEALARMADMQDIECFTVEVPKRLPHTPEETFCTRQNREGVQITFHKKWGGE